MTNLADTLAGVGVAVVEAAVAACADDGLRGCDEGVVLAVLVEAGRVRRAAEAVMVEAVAQLLDRDETVGHADRTTTRHGCRNMGELVQRATRVSGRTATDLVAAARAVQQRTSLSSGETLPAEYPALRDALTRGEVGVEGVAAVAGVFRGSLAGREGLLAADEELAAAACGEGADAAPPATADELRALAQVWAAYLDQDGAEPVEARALRKRGFAVGRRGEDGLVPVRGNVLPEVAAQLQLGLDSVLNPRVDGAPDPGAGVIAGFASTAGPQFVSSEPGDRGDFDDRDSDLDEPGEAVADSRTATQKRHDAFATLITAAAASGTLPTLGGAAPTLVVQVREEDLATGRGYAHLPGDEAPISLAVARQTACTGAVQRVVLGKNGRITSISTLDRVFSHHQRRALTLRDGGCIIPGCPVPPQWCEIHHVIEHSRGGPTHTDNGVLLCWFHHRTIDTGAWRIRMIDGIPHVKGPHWWDSTGHWRPTTKSPTRKRDLINLRT